MALFNVPQASLPSEAFEDLLPAVIDVLKTVYDAGDSDEPKRKLAIAAATDDLKRKLARARELVENLPGGKMLVRDQDQAIKALEGYKQQRRSLLLKFAAGSVAESSTIALVS